MTPRKSTLGIKEKMTVGSGATVHTVGVHIFSEVGTVHRSPPLSTPHHHLKYVGVHQNSPNGMANVTALTHILVHLQSLGVPELDDKIIKLRKNRTPAGTIPGL